MSLSALQLVSLSVYLSAEAYQLGPQSVSQLVELAYPSGRVCEYQSAQGYVYRWGWAYVCRSAQEYAYP